MKRWQSTPLQEAFEEGLAQGLQGDAQTSPYPPHSKEAQAYRQGYREGTLQRQHRIGLERDD